MSATPLPTAVPARRASLRGMPLLGVGLVAGLLVLALVAWWDAQRESAAALGTFAEEQSTLARAIAASSGAGRGERDVRAGLRDIELPGARILLFAPSAGGDGWTTTDGRTLRLAALDWGRAAPEGWIRLTHEESASLGLPPRTSIAGFAAFATAPAARWTIAVVTSAERERDRELHTQSRRVLGVLLAAGLVLVFGGIALRKQRTELELARELAVREVQRERDERLVRADKLATMGALATGIAHEVSTPLGVIVGRAAQLLPKVQGDERARRGVEAILEQGERIDRVIRGFLSLARGDSPPFERVEPATIVRKSVELVEHRFTKAGVELRTEVAPSLPAIACEPRLLEQAVVNLLLNACDACQPGARVELAAALSGRRVSFVVLDDGVGIAPSLSASILEPFFTTKRSGEGTGLGLAIAKEIVGHHHGELMIASRPARRGTRACIEIPTAEDTS